MNLGIRLKAMMMGLFFLGLGLYTHDSFGGIEPHQDTLAPQSHPDIKHDTDLESVWSQSGITGERLGYALIKLDNHRMHYLIYSHTKTRIDYALIEAERGSILDSDGCSMVDASSVFLNQVDEFGAGWVSRLYFSSSSSICRFDYRLGWRGKQKQISTKVRGTILDSKVTHDRMGRGLLITQLRMSQHDSSIDLIQWLDPYDSDQPMQEQFHSVLKDAHRLIWRQGHLFIQSASGNHQWIFQGKAQAPRVSKEKFDSLLRGRRLYELRD